MPRLRSRMLRTRSRALPRTALRPSAVSASARRVPRGRRPVHLASLGIGALAATTLLALTGVGLQALFTIVVALALTLLAYTVVREG
jgi:hypothetical protein